MTPATRQIKIPVKRQSPTPSQRQRNDASKMVDVLILVQIIQTSLYGLQIEFDNAALLKHSTKRIINQAVNFILPLSGAAFNVFNMTSPTLAKAYIETYDAIQKGIDDSIYLKGTEREFAIIYSACKICKTLLQEVEERTRSTFPKVLRIQSIIDPLIDPSTIPDISSIIRLVLKSRLMGVN